MKREPDRAVLGRDLPIRRLITGLWQMADQERDGKPFDLDAVERHDESADRSIRRNTRIRTHPRRVRPPCNVCVDRGA